MTGDLIRWGEAQSDLCTAFPPGPKARYALNWYKGEPPDGTPFPYIVLTDLGEPPPTYWGAPRGQNTVWYMPHFQLALYAEGDDAADTLGRQVRDALDGMDPGNLCSEGKCGALYRDLYREAEATPSRSAAQNPVWQVILAYHAWVYRTLPVRLMT